MAGPLKRYEAFNHYGTDASTPKRRRMFEPTPESKLQKQMQALFLQNQMILQNQNTAFVQSEQILSHLSSMEARHEADEFEAATPKVIDERLINIFSELPLPIGECNLIVDQEEWKVKLKKMSDKISRQVTRESSKDDVKKATFGLRDLSVVEEFQCNGIVSDGNAFVTHEGSKHKNEDVFVQFNKDILTTEGNRNATCVAVFDGHGGDLVSTYCRDHLEESLKICLEQFNASGQDFEIVNAMKMAFVRLDASIRKEHNQRDSTNCPGCTALMVLIIGKRLYVGNSGDCRALLIPDDPKAFKLLSFDYNAAYEDAVNSVKKRGGQIIFNKNVHRVNGSLMITRAIGDEYLRSNASGIKPITPRPGVMITELSEYEKQSNIQLLVCSDGLTAAGYSLNIAQAACEARKQGKSSLETAELLLRAARKNRVTDDITVGLWDLKTMVFSQQT